MIIIGEKINATLSSVNIIIQNRDAKSLVDLAKEQTDAGAGFIDVNVGTGVGSLEYEVQSMKWAVQTIQEEVETPICIDSADPAVLEAGLKTRRGGPSMINSTKADEKYLEKLTPLAREYDALLVGLAMDETGIPKTVQDRLRACEKILAACGEYDVPLDTVFIDPLLMPISTDVKQGLVTLSALSEIKKKFPETKTILGISNVSYGLPARRRLNAAFLHMAIYAGLDAAFIDPLDGNMMAAVKTGEVLVGKDRHCRKYIRAFHK